MSLSICPSAVTHASVDRDWSLLVNPLAYAMWSDATVERVVPEGRARAGQRIELRAPRRGRLFAVRFLVESVDDASRLVTAAERDPAGTGDSA